MNPKFRSATVNLRTAKIQLLQLLNDRTPVEQFDVDGPFDFSDALKPLDDFRQTALDARPDLRAALQTIQQSETNHKLADLQRFHRSDLQRLVHLQLLQQQSQRQSRRSALSVNIPLRIFDRNQGEKQRTQIDIDKQPADQRRRPRPGLQRRRLGLRAGGEQHRTAQALQGKSTTTRPPACATP